MPMNLKFIILCFLLPLCAIAQQEDLTKDKIFFEEQAKSYNQWLQSTGLGSLLSVKEIEVESNTLSIYLAFPDEEINFVVNAWNKLKTEFELNVSMTLEQQLFYKALHYMQVEQEQMDLQLYDTYDLAKTPLFFRGIYFAEGQVKVEEDNPKSVIREVSIPKPPLTSNSNVAEVQLKQDLSKELVFRKILQQANIFYSEEDKKVNGRIPVFRPLGELDQLRFEISDLTSEVVTDQRQSFFCSLIRRLDYPCNWSPREVLTYTISYEDKGEALALKIEIDGRLGSGVYANARRRSYISLDVEHYPQLEAYAEQMRELIYSWLIQP
ncbi:MAG: hypothetical protein Sapg2KO_51420 [Saprospiraceae bacterium]